MPKQKAMASKKMKYLKTKSKEENKQALMLKPIKNDASDTSVKISTNIINPETIIEILHSVQLTELELKLSQVQVQNPLNNIHNVNKLEISKKSQCSLRRDEVLDKLLQSEFQEKVGENRHPISSLPIFEKREEILDLIDKNQVVVICGEPGCGKTTQIPQFILDEYIKSGNGSLCNIVSTQPYKKNVTTAVDKVSKDRRGIFGNADGINYQFRFHKSISRNPGSVTYCTSGILMKQVANSSFLSKITHVIIDEIQERDKSTDFLLSFMKELVNARNDIKLILICSSIYSKKIVKYYNKCVKIDVSPELHSVEEYFLEDIIMLTNFNNLAENGHFEKDKKFKKHEKRRKYPMALKRFVENYEKLNHTNGFLIISLIKCIYTEYHNGNILIIVPSIFDINFLATKIKEDNSLNSKTHVTTLTQFEISTEDKTLKFNHKIFLTTNEKFVDLNKSNIVFVIDSGRIQVKNYITNVEIVKNEWISQKTSNQRKRLASRYKPGICFHLFSQDSIENFVKYPIPEIMKCDLERIIIEIKEFGIENAELFLKNCLSSPDIYCIRQTIENLKNNNILSNEEYLTPLGLNIAKLPLKYAIGKMVIYGAFFNCLEPILNIAAYLSFKSIFKGKDTEILEMKHHLSFSCDSDILLILNLFDKFKQYRNNEDEFFQLCFIKPATFKEMNNIKQQLSDRLFEMNILPASNYKLLEYNMNSENMKLLKALLSVALNQNIAVIRNHESDKLKNIFIETATQKSVFMYQSINTGKTCLPTPLLLYRSSFEEKYNFIQETTFVTPLQVLFFANDVKYSTENQESHSSVIIVADYLKIFCSQSTSSIIQLVQENFNKWFDYKLRNPGYVDWTKESWDTSVLRAVIHLLNNEEENNFLF